MGTVDGWETDEFLVEAAGDEAGALDALTALAELLEPVEPAPDARARLLGAAALEGRFSRFTDAVARMLDLGRDAAAAVLDVIDQPARWLAGPGPGSSCWVTAGPGLANAITGFMRLPAGETFPVHTHLGDEQMLVIQGRYIDDVSGLEHGPGALVEMGAQTTHSFHVPSGGPALVYLTVIHEGVDISGTVVRPSDRPPDA